MDFELKDSHARSQRLSIFAYPVKDPHASCVNWKAVFFALSALLGLASIACLVVVSINTTGASLQVAPIPILPSGHEADASLLAHHAGTNLVTIHGLAMDDFELIKGLPEYNWQIIYQGACTHGDAAKLAALACSHPVNSVLLDTGSLFDTVLCKIVLDEEIHKANCTLATGIVS